MSFDVNDFDYRASTERGIELLLIGEYTSEALFSRLPTSWSFKKRELPLKPCFRDFPLAGPLTSPSVNKGSSFAGKEPILGREVCLGDCSVLL